MPQPELEHRFTAFGTTRRGRFASASALALVTCLLGAAEATALPAFSTAPKSALGTGDQVELYSLRTGCHPTFDRVVLRGRFGTPAYDVRYVTRIVEDGSGDPVPLLGTRRIRVLLRDSRGHTEDGTESLLPAVRTPRCPNLRQVKVAGDFEGQVSLGLGLRRRTGFRVFRLTGPTRVVVDVSH